MTQTHRIRFGINHLLLVTAIVATFVGLSMLGKSIFQMLPVLCLVYAGKLIGARETNATRILIHLGLCVVTLPYIYLLVAGDADSPNDWRSMWIGIPIVTYFVPTCSLLYDIALEDTYEKGRGFFILRSAIEILILVPMWIVVWIFIEVAILGWIFI